MEQDCDVATLVEMIKESAFGSHEQQYLAHQAARALEAIAILSSGGG
jgi:hypothetical protein